MDQLKNKIISICLQGDITEVVKYLNTMEESGQQLKKRFIRRFYNDLYRIHYPTNDPWVRSVLRMYYNYFIDVLTRRVDQITAENNLAFDLSRILDTDHLKLLDIDTIEEELSVQFKKKGYYFLGGVTTPYRGPYIWRTTVTNTYDISLPYGEQTLTVHFLKDFIMAGWLHFASFGVSSTAGWAKEDGLYCIYKRYKKDLDKDAFQASFLKHEAQHVLDYGMFPNLKATDLEYRAKLVELIYYKDNTRLFYFIETAKRDPKFPHPYAAFLIVKHLSERLFNVGYIEDRIIWNELDYRQVQICARELLDIHTDELQAIWKEITEGLYVSSNS